MTICHLNQLRREADYSKWSGKTIEAIAEIINHKSEATDFGVMGPMDHREWDNKLNTIQFEKTATDTGFTVQQLKDGFASQQGNLEEVPF